MDDTMQFKRDPDTGEVRGVRIGMLSLGKGAQEVHCRIMLFPDGVRLHCERGALKHIKVDSGPATLGL